MLKVVSYCPDEDVLSAVTSYNTVDVMFNINAEQDFVTAMTRVYLIALQHGLQV